MVDCAFCERPLTCDSCRATFQPTNIEDYRALSWSEQPIICPQCGLTLVCHWCKTPYDGADRDDDTAGD